LSFKQELKSAEKKRSSSSVVEFFMTGIFIADQAVKISVASILIFPQLYSRLD